MVINPNGAPVAVAGPDQSVSEGDTVILDGTASYDPEGDVLNYQWTLLRLPAGSTATLSDPTAASPRLTADQAGQYEVELIVDDGVLTSSPDMLWITAESSGSSSSSSCSSCAEVVRREAAQHGSLRGVMTGPGLMLFPLLTLGWWRRSSLEEPEDTPLFSGRPPP